MILLLYIQRFRELRSAYTILPFNTSLVSGLQFPMSLSILVILSLFYSRVPNECKVDIIVVLISISLMSNGIAYLFMCLFVICILLCVDIYSNCPYFF